MKFFWRIDTLVSVGTITAMIFVVEKSWWGWLISLCNQVLWIIMIKRQRLWGLVPSWLVLSAIAVWGLFSWWGNR